MRITIPIENTSLKFHILDYKDKRFLTVVFLMIVISSLHYSIPSPNPLSHGLLRFLYYIPLLITALSFGSKGGLLISIIIVIIYSPHLILTWGEIPLQTFEAVFECIIYIVVGYFVGLVTERNRHRTFRYDY